MISAMWWPDMQQFGRWAWFVYLFLWAWSVPLLALGLVPPGTEWMATVILVLAGSLCGWWLWQRFASTGLLVAMLIWGGSWAAEHVGVQTGLLFGRYEYSGVLQPTLGGVVPLAIPFAWLMVVPGAFELARMLLGPQARPLPQTLLAATLATLLDVVIEPVAVHINGYWRWLDGGPLTGVPLSNYASWWALAAIFVLVMWVLIDGSRWRGRVHQGPWSLPVLVFGTTLVLFTVVNLAYGEYMAGGTGVVLLGTCLALLRHHLPELKHHMVLRTRI